jgi:hypothetical protein
MSLLNRQQPVRLTKVRIVEILGWLLLVLLGRQVWLLLLVDGLKSEIVIDYN